MEIQQAAVVRGCAGLEVGGKTEESVVRCQRSVEARTEGGSMNSSSKD